MITDSGKYYLYRHIRLDKNEPFYIGIGTKFTNTKFKEYNRSKTKRGRCDFWKNITNKTNYEIEILLESDDYEFIKEKEIEFIKLYGRKDLNEGTLVNLTNGGDGAVGYTCTKEAKLKLRNANLGKKYSDEVKKKVSEHSKELWQKRRDQGEDFIEDFYKNLRASKIIKVNQYSIQGEFIKTWDSISDAMRYLNIKSTTNIVYCCKGKRPSASGYVWRYIDDEFDKYPYVSRGHYKRGEYTVPQERKDRIRNTMLSKHLHTNNHKLKNIVNEQ